MANIEDVYRKLKELQESGITIVGDVVVDNVGIENVAGEKINPATEETLAKLLERPQSTYTWVNGLLVGKVSVYADRTETTTYTWSNGLLSDKITVIT